MMCDQNGDDLRLTVVLVGPTTLYCTKRASPGTHEKSLDEDTHIVRTCIAIASFSDIWIATSHDFLAIAVARISCYI